jgi:hypothetical protein
LTNIFVAAENMKWLWFTAAESAWELLLKEHYPNKNPFMEISDNKNDPQMMISSQTYR